MYVCMYVCLYIFMYICVYVCLYVCTYVFMYVYMYVCIYVCMYIYLGRQRSGCFPQRGAICQEALLMSTPVVGNIFRMNCVLSTSEAQPVSSSVSKTPDLCVSD